MKIGEINNFYRGWLVGSFEPSLFNNNDIEIGVKKYKKGDYENKHFHKIATEYTIIISGEVIMNNIIYKENDIILIKPNEETDFKCLEDTITLVIKTPSITNDKYDSNIT